MSSSLSHVSPCPSFMSSRRRALAGALVVAALVAGGPARSEEDATVKVESRTVEYRDGDTVLEGMLFHDPAAKGPRPGVLVAHAWMGLNEQAKRSAERLARMGYVAFAVDVYGKGIRPTNPQDAAKEASKYKNDRALTRSRMKAGLEQLTKAPGVDASRIGAIGYCFGGMCVLELARSGADIDAVVTFHGSLDTPTPADAKAIKAKVLALHGADDPFVPQDVAAAFLKEMKDARIDFQLVQYGGAVHSFTDEDAGNDPSKGQAYNPVVAKRAWAAMTALFAETLGS